METDTFGDPVADAVKAAVLADLAQHGKPDPSTDTLKLCDLHWDADDVVDFFGRIHDALLRRSFFFDWPPPKAADALGYTIDDLIGAIADGTAAA